MTSQRTWLNQETTEARALAHTVSARLHGDPATAEEWKVIANQASMLERKARNLEGRLRTIEEAEEVR